MIWPRVSVALVVLALCSWFPASAQSVISTHSGVVYFFEGSVLLGDQPLEQKFGKFPDIGEGRELRTEQGRAEVLLTPGVFLRMAENSRIRMLSCSLADTRVELLNGSATIESGEASPDTSAVVMYKSWKARVPSRAIFRMDAEPPQLRVFKGEVGVSAQGKTDTVTAKEGQALPLSEVLLTEDAPAANDSFDRWAMQRSQAIFADNSTAAQIFDDPSMVDSSGLALGGLSYFPMTGIPALGLGSPYGLSFWSPFQPSLTMLYMRPYGLGWAYPGYTNGLRFLLPPARIGGIGSPTRIGGGVPSTGIPTYRTAPAYVPHAPAHPAGGVHAGAHR